MWNGETSLNPRPSRGFSYTTNGPDSVRAVLITVKSGLMPDSTALPDKFSIKNKKKKYYLMF